MSSNESKRSVALDSIMATKNGPQKIAILGLDIMRRIALTANKLDQETAKLIHEACLEIMFGMGEYAKPSLAREPLRRKKQQEER